MTTNNEICYFKKIKDENLSPTSWEQVFNWIKVDPSIKAVTNNFRSAIAANQWDLSKAEHKRAYQNLKVGLLPGFLPGGVFLTTKKDDLESYSGVVHVDFDNISNEETNSLLEFVSKEKSALLCFRSPGGRGIKIFHRIRPAEPILKVQPETIQDFHNCAFEEVSNLYRRHGLMFNGFDKSVSNINRACYLSHDPDAVTRLDAQPITVTFNAKKEENENEENNELEEWYMAQAQKYMTVDSTEASGRIEELIEWLKVNKVSITNEYDKWIRVIFALKGTFDNPTAEKYAREFSQLDASFDEAEFLKKFNQKNVTKKKAPTIGTIMHYAKDVGYKPKKKLMQKGYLKDIIRLLVKYEWKIRYNVMFGTLEKNSEEKWKPLVDSDIDELKAGVFQHTYARSNLTETLYVISPKFYPSDHLKEKIQQWDGKDHIKELVQTLDCGSNKWAKIFIVRWIMGLLAGITRPDSYNENVLVLHGIQGAGKTRWVRRLFEEALISFELEPERYFKQKQIDPGNKDDLLLLCTSFIVFFDEMHTIVNNRTNIEAFKNMTSATTQTIRKPYGRISEDFRRYASIIGTVNEEQFLVDSTGNRRFWVISVGKVNQNHTVNIPQVFSQAWHLLNSGERYYLNAEETKELNEYLTRYDVVKAEEELIRNHVVESDGNYMTTTQVIFELTQLYNRDVIKCGAANFGKLLKKHFGHVHKVTKKGRFYRVVVERAGVRITGDIVGVGVTHPDDLPPITTVQQFEKQRADEQAEIFLN